MGLARDTLATRSRHARDTLATFPQPQALLETLLQAFYRVLELQFLRVTDTLTDGQTDRHCVCPSVCLCVTHRNCSSSTL